MISKKRITTLSNSAEWLVLAKTTRGFSFLGSQFPLLDSSKKKKNFSFFFFDCIFLEAKRSIFTGLSRIVLIIHFHTLIFAAWRRYQAVSWLESLVGPIGISNQPSERAFISCLRNGLILCNAINKINPGTVLKVWHFFIKL
jgi:hypothetical protein